MPTTTETPVYEYEYDENSDYDGPLTIDVELFGSFIEKTITVDTVFSFIGFFVNIFHLVILTRHELRTKFIYIFMIAICLLELLMLIVMIIADVIESNILYQIEYDCYGGRPKYHAYFAWIANAIRDVTRRCSAWLALLMALFRTVAVMFPMNISIQNLMKPTAGLITILVTFIICLLADGLFYIRYKMTKITKYQLSFCFDTPQNFTYAHYLHIYPPKASKFLDLYKSVDGCSKIFTSFLYLIISVALIFTLKMAQKRRENLRKQEESDNTSKLILVMAITFFFSEFPLGASYIIEQYLWKRNHDVQYVTQSLVFMIMTIITINSTVHCLICFVLSSQYRDVAKKTFGCCKRRTEPMTEMVTATAT